MADHIFEDSLVQEMRGTLPQHVDVRLLVEFATDALCGLPRSTVRVESSPCKSMALSVTRSTDMLLQENMGVEAGLLTCRAGALFGELAVLSQRGGYFTLAEAVNLLAVQSRVAVLSTAGKHWVAVETYDELQQLQQQQVRVCIT